MTLKTQEKQFSSKGVKIKVTEAYLEAVSDKAIKRKIIKMLLNKKEFQMKFFLFFY